MKKLDLKKLTDDQLEEAARELWRRREEAAKKLGAELQDVNSDDAVAPSVKFKTPYGSLVMCQSREDGYRAYLDGEQLSYMDLFPDDDENDAYDKDQDMAGDVANVIRHPHYEMAWRCAKFVKQHEDLLKQAMVKETHEG